MWLFTKHGFFSAVCARQGDGKHTKPVDSDPIMVRGRVRGHLEVLKKRLGDLLGTRDIKDFAGTDYPIRLIVAKKRALVPAMRRAGKDAKTEPAWTGRQDGPIASADVPRVDGKNAKMPE
jgi:hypothetical protein